MADSRPPLDKDISPRDFEEFYWLKKELHSFCKAEGLPSTGSKRELATRILSYLKTGEKPKRYSSKTSRPRSRFDWSKEVLSPATIITDNYSNTENVRSFFTHHIGPGFRFRVPFMRWMKDNTGKTLGDAMEAWQVIEQSLKSGSKEIAPQFEYNRYLRDFCQDNPDLSRDIGIKLWKIKKQRRGSNAYEQSDLDFLSDQ